MNQDEILLELLNRLKEENTDLKKRLNKKTRSLLGLEDLWATFWTTVGGIWKDFWTTVSTMWLAIWEKDEAIFGMVVVIFILSIAGGITSYHIVKLLQ